jgi:hypothetical protein
MKRHKLMTGTLVAVLLLCMVPHRTEAQTISGAEYFIDQDPGVGKATAMAAVDGLYNAKMEVAQSVVDTSGLSTGPHMLGVRFRKSDGAWSYTRRTWFRVSGQPTLKGAEWFIDTDPGKGKGHPIALPVDGVWDKSQEEISINNIDISGLKVNGPTDPNGHTLFVRFLDSDGNWGLPRQARFQVAPALHIASARWSTQPDDPTAQPNSGTAMQAQDGAFDEPTENLVATGVTLPAGCSTIYVRAQDNLGRWSTWHGYYLDANGQWKFDPAKAYPSGSKLDFCYAGLGSSGTLAAPLSANPSAHVSGVRPKSP